MSVDESLTFKIEVQGDLKSTHLLNTSHFSSIRGPIMKIWHVLDNRLNQMP